MRKRFMCCALLAVVITGCNKGSDPVKPAPIPSPEDTPVRNPPVRGVKNPTPSDNNAYSKLEGRWIVVDAHRGGKQEKQYIGVIFDFQPPRMVRNVREVRTLRVKAQTGRFSWEVDLGGTKEPKEIDLFYERSNDEQPRPYRTGIYKFENDTLIYCDASKKRPIDFTTTPDDKDDQTMHVLKRHKDEGK